MNEKCKGCRWQRNSLCLIAVYPNGLHCTCRSTFEQCGDNFSPLIPADYKAAVDKLVEAIKIHPGCAIGDCHCEDCTHLEAALAELEKVTIP